MKILFHINSLGKGGAEHVAALLAAYLQKAGDETVFATEWEEAEEYALPAGVRRADVGVSAQAADKGRAPENICARLFHILCRIYRLRACIRRERPDIVLSFVKKANYRAALALFGKSIPLIISVRNDPKTDYGGRGKYWINRYMLRKAKGCVFQTPDAAAFFGEGFLSRSRIIGNPIEDRFFETERAVPAKEAPRIVTIGRLTAQKNQLLLLRAYDRALDVLRRAESGEERTLPVLEIYGADSGDGSREGLLSYIAKRELSELVFLKGTTEAPERALSRAALFALSSDYEGLPNALLEAMAVGVPCVSTDCPCGGPRMMIENGVNGWLVPVGDEVALSEAMLRLLTQTKAAEAMGQEAKKDAEALRADTVCKEWRAYIGEVWSRAKK